jgi:uncharacterized protein YjdB
MFHRLVCALAVLAFTAVGLLAGETRGTIKFLNVKKGSLTITVTDKEKNTKDVDFMVPATAKVIDNEGNELKGRLKALKAGDVLIVTTEKDGDKDVVKEVKRK